MTAIRLPERIRGLSLDLGNTIYPYRAQEISNNVRCLHRFLEARLSARLPSDTLERLYIEIRDRQMRDNLPTLCENDFDERLHEMITHVHEPPAGDLVREASDAYGAGFVETLQLPSGMRDTLASLSRQYGGRVVVCSNFMLSEPIRDVLLRDNLMPYFAGVIVSRDIGFVKPHASMFDAVREILNLDPAEIAHVGDNLEADIVGGRLAGMTTVYTSEFCEPAHPRKVSEAAPDYTITRLSEIVCSND